MENPNNFLVNTDYPLDMIIYYKYYVLTTTSNKRQSISFPHGLGFTPLVFGSWSSTADFEKTIPFTEYSKLTSISFAFDDMISVEADDTNIYIDIYQYSPQSGRKRYLKIYGFAPTTWTGECAPTAQSNSNLILDTDKKYCPLLAAGAVKPRRLDVMPEPPTPEQTGILLVIGKDGYKEASGRAATISCYYQDPISPTIMLWKTTGTTGRTGQAMNALSAKSGFALRNPPYARFGATGTAPGARFIEISAGTTRTGQATYDNITHFRIYA